MGRRKLVTKQEVVALHELCDEILESIDDYGSTPAECMARRFFQRKIRAIMKQFALKNGDVIRRAVLDEDISGEHFEEGFEE